MVASVANDGTGICGFCCRFKQAAIKLFDSGTLSEKSENQGRGEREASRIKFINKEKTQKWRLSYEHVGIFFVEQIKTIFK